jgi:hypothetical protein
VQPDDHLPFSSFGCAWEAKDTLNKSAFSRR